MLTREKSSKVNGARLTLMKERQELVVSIKEDVVARLRQLFQQDRVYETLLQKLVVQGMVKLMEKNVKVKTLSRDLPLAGRMKAAAEREFEEIIRRETGLQLHSAMEACQEYSLDDEGVNDLGGAVLTCHEGRICCKSTVQSRVDMAFEDCLPAIRAGLFG